MTSQFESDIRARLAEALGGALGLLPETRLIHLPARASHASFRPPQGSRAESLLSLDYGSLYGAPLVEKTRVVNGWLLFDFSAAFFSALTDRILPALPAPDTAGETLAENRMNALSRHGGTGCPDIPAFHRALLLALTAHESLAAYRRAERAALSLFHTIPPRDRPAILSACGSLGGALLRLLVCSRSTAHIL